MAAPTAAASETITLAAVGDVLPHRRLKAYASRAGWSAVFQDVLPLLRDADLAFANLESPVAGAHRGLAGEVFNAPADLLPALRDAGFDVVSMANNHTFDQGPAGLLETWTRARAAKLHPVGAGPTCAQARAPAVTEVRGVRIAWLAMTDLLNADERAGEDAPCVFVAGPVCAGDCGPDRDAIHFSLDEARLREAVHAARAVADVVVLSAHWGDEYRTVPLPEYPKLAALLTDEGVDVLIGHHPHVPQRIERRTTARGTPALIAYSLGNFVSDMGRTYNPTTGAATRGFTRDGLVLQVSLTVAGGALTALSASVTPTWADNQDTSLGADEDLIRVLRHASLPAEVAARRRAALLPVLSDDVPMTSPD